MIATQRSQPLFELGQVVGTPAALAALEENGRSPLEFLARHQVGDWGVVDDEDKALNDRAVRDGSRILSAYLLDDQEKLWVITEATDEQGRRAATTILLPAEY